MSIKTGDVIVTTKYVSRICGSVQEDTEGKVDQLDYNDTDFCWVKFPGHARTMKMHSSEFKKVEG